MSDRGGQRGAGRCGFTWKLGVLTMARKNTLPGIAAGRHALSLGARSAELGFAAPQVIAIRLGRMMQPGLPDTVEFQRMFTEKQSAFWRAGLAMAQQTFALQMSLCGAM